MAQDKVEGMKNRKVNRTGSTLLFKVKVATFVHQYALHSNDSATHLLTLVETFNTPLSRWF